MSRAASVARYLESRSACVARSRASAGPRNDSIRFVGTNVGITTETCVLRAASSPLSVSLNERTAALVALYEIMPGADAKAAALATLISSPDPLRCRCGIAARAPCTTPMKLMSTIQRQSSTDTSIIEPEPATPALFTITSRPSCVAAKEFTATVSSSAFVTSPG